MPAWAAVRLRRLNGRAGTFLLFAALLAVALTLRWNNLSWDQGHLFHPDERHIFMVTAGLALPLPVNWSLLLSPQNPLNPHSFAYGSLPFYLLKLCSQALSAINGPPPAGELDQLRIVGRVISGLFDAGSVALVFLIGRRLFNRQTGLLAAAFLALSALSIQYAHFYASDTLLTFFLLLATLFSIDVYRTGGWRPAALAGLAVGLAAASKISALPIFALIATAHLLRLFVQRGPDARRLRWRTPTPAEINQAMSQGALTLAVAASVFSLVEPYAWIDAKTFLSNMTAENDMARGIADLPYTRQYADTPAYWYFLQNLLVWGLGPPLGLAVLGGALASLIAVFKRPARGAILLLAWVVPYFAITGSFHAKFLRYMIPLIPFLCLLAAFELERLRGWAAGRHGDHAGALTKGPAMPAGAVAEGVAHAAASGLDAEPSKDQLGSNDGAAPSGRSYAVGADVPVRPYFWPALPAIRRFLRPGRLEILVSGLIVLALAGGALYAAAFGNIYASRHTAVEGSEWIYRNVPAGSAILTEHWEEGMPVPMSLDGKHYDAGRMGYRTLTLDAYEPDGPAKLAHITQRLADADYVVFFSNRLYGTIPRLPQRYPVTGRYYQQLFAEKLGFRLVAAFAKSPSVFGLTLTEDTLSDPKLAVPGLLSGYQPSPLSISGGKADESFSVYDHPKVLVFKKQERLTQQQLGELIGPARAPTGQAPPATPAKTLLLPDAERAAVAAGGTFAGLFNRNDLANRLPIPVWVALLQILGLLGAPIAFAVFRRLPDRGYLLARPLAILLLTWLDWMAVSLGLISNTRAAAGLALVMLGIIGVSLARCQWDDLRAFWREHKGFVLWGEVIFWAAFALFLLIRAANPDLWHPARGGEKPMDLAYLMAAIKSESFPPYDPWFAGGYLNYYYYGQIIVATLVKLSGVVPTTAYNLVIPALFALTFGAVVSAAGGLLGNGRAATRRWIGTGVLAALLATLLGNLGGATQLIEQIVRLGPEPLRSSLPGVQGVFAFLAGLWRLLVGHQPLVISTDWYWASTRVIEGTINEFPFFTFLYADLHAHMIALPFTMLALALAINTLPLAGEVFHLRHSQSQRRLALKSLPSVAVAALVIGALMPTNSWDFPTYLAIYALALLAGWYVSRPLRFAGLVLVGLQIIVVAALSYVLYLPFHNNFQQWYLGVDQIKDKSDIGGYLRIHGLFLFAIGSFLATETARRFGRSGLLRLAGLYWRRRDLLPRALHLQGLLVSRDDVRGQLALYGFFFALALSLTLHLMGMTLLAALVGLLLWTALLAVDAGSSPGRLFTLILIGMGLTLSATVELVAIKGDIGRMNTVFKFYLQVWTLWSVAAAAGLYYSRQHIVALWPRRRREIWHISLAILLAAAFVYPLVATRARIADRFDPRIAPTLDGTAYMPGATFREENPDSKQASEIHLGSDLPAITWLQDNVPGSPVILEGWAPLYRWGARYSIYTGLPTVIGWDWHQKQQRWGYQSEVDRRLADVKAIYSAPALDNATALLAKYDVRYIVVGELEKAVYSPVGLAKFDQLVGRGWDIVYENRGVKIYRRL